MIASCGGDDSPPQLADGSKPEAPPAVLDDLDDAVFTRTRVVSRQERGAAAPFCFPGQLRNAAAVVERVGVDGRSLTVEPGAGHGLLACDAIPADLPPDPDRPRRSPWCGLASGRLTNGVLNDPRLDLCQAVDGQLTAFAWVSTSPGAHWVVVLGEDRREVYEISASLPVRVTTTENVDRAGSASFEIEEYAADGRKVREYALDAQVAG